jgi:hypothetical protein
MKNFFRLLVLLSLSFMSFAQYDVDDVESDSSATKDPKINPFILKDKIYVGSGLNLLFGSTTFFYISPIVGYDITDKFSAGVVTMYQYYRQSYGGGNYSSSNSFGLGVFARYRPISQLILETSLNGYTTTFNGSDKVNSKSWMLGLGYANSMGKRSYYQFMVQYDLLKDYNVPEPAIVNFPGGGRLYYKLGIVFYLSNN